MPKLKKWSEVSKEKLSHIKAICFDIDDTITSSGKLKPESYSALWKLKEAGFYLIPITGRPASWCDHIIRFWPVDAIIGENGAFTFFMDNGARKRIDTLGDGAKEALNKIKSFKSVILEEFPEAVWASDQDYREYDVAIDFCEDVEPWSSEQVKALAEFCKSKGAKAKISSIHVNTWFGEYDKCTGIEYWLKNGNPGVAEKMSMDNMIFIGDSQNDEPLFEAFPLSVGVANINDFLDILNHPPTWVTDSKSGDGFVEFATGLIDSRL